MKIGELAKRSGIATETIRYYEKQKLIPEPLRTEANYRIYDRSHLDRLIFIRNCRAFDMTHEEIHQLLNEMRSNQKGCEKINEIVYEHIKHIDIRINELIDLKDSLVSLQNACGDDHLANQCTILQGLSNMNLKVTKTTHLG